MKALEVFVNGHRVCLAGVGEDGVLSAIVDWTGGPAEDDHVGLNVGGLGSRTGEHLGWEVPSLGVGAEVLVRVVEAAAVDPPSRRVRYDEKTRLDDYRQQLQECAEDLAPEERRQLLPELIAELQALDAEPGVAPDRRPPHSQRGV